MKMRVVFTVEAPQQTAEELRTSIAAAVTDAVASEIPGATVQWTSIGGQVPEVVTTAQANGRSVRSQADLDQDAHWS